MAMREHKGKSIIALPTEYVVIDTETTGLDYDRCNLIEVSALRYANGECIDRFSSLIQPPLLQYFKFGKDDELIMFECYVDNFISELTGITNEMLESAPTPEQVIPQFIEFLGDSVLIGHNVHFDINFLYDAAEHTCKKPLSNNFVDTLRIARKVFPELAHHRLSDIAAACNIRTVKSHRAEADCETTACCYESMRAAILSTMSEESFADSFQYSYDRILEAISATTESVDTTNPIYGKVVVFTGSLSDMSRKEAFQIVVNLGGIPSDSLNAKTNFLVIGNAEFAKSVKDGKTNKMKKAEKMIQKGSELSVISESAFFDMLSDYQIT